MSEPTPLPAEKLVAELRSWVEEFYRADSLDALLVKAADEIERLSREPHIVGWMVGKPGNNPAMYNLAQRAEAFDAARRWNRPIVALVVHPEAPHE